MAMKPARTAPVWGAAALIAGALLMVAPPATAATTAEPGPQAIGTTSGEQAITMHPPGCIGQELVLQWTAIPDAFGYRIFADGVWFSGSHSNIANFYGVDQDIIWTVRAIDESGTYISLESNGVKSPCQEAGS
jgi:hypothetical protein